MNKLSIEEKIDLNNLNYFLKIMRITLFFLFFSVLFATASGTYSQTINLELKSSTIKEVCSEIERNSDYIFIFSDKIVEKLNSEVSINGKATEVHAILDNLFSNT